MHSLAKVLDCSSSDGNPSIDRSIGIAIHPDPEKKPRRLGNVSQWIHHPRRKTYVRVAPTPGQAPTTLHQIKHSRYQMQCTHHPSGKIDSPSEHSSSERYTSFWWMDMALRDILSTHHPAGCARTEEISSAGFPRSILRAEYLIWLWFVAAVEMG